MPLHVGTVDQTGRLDAGMDADFLVLERNPLEDIRAIQDPLVVVNNGRIVLVRR